MNPAWRAAGVTVVALLAVGGGLATLGMLDTRQPGPTQCGPVAGPTDAPYVGISGMPCTRSAIIAGEIQGHAAPGGPLDGTVIGDARSEAGVGVVILGDSVVASGVPWVRIYVPTYESGAGDRDIFTWVPVSQDQTLHVIDIAETACPSSRDNLSTLGVLDPITRARCLGGGPLILTGATGEQRGPVGYDVDPPWLSGWRGRLGFSIRNEAVGEPIDVQLPDGVAGPPVGFVIQLAAHVADPAARSCTRSVNDFEDTVEAPADSALWCAARLVAERWTATLGPERRPIDPAAPQLHRFTGSGACAGVNMGLLQFHMDATALDPVWLESESGSRVVPWFTDAFRTAFEPDLVVVDRSGQVVARDGQIVNPDRTVLGHSMCGTLRGVFFE